MGARNIADGVNHRQNDQAERQRDAQRGNAAAAYIVDDNRSRRQRRR